MAHLTLAGVSDDGSRVLLVSDKGVEFTLDITPGLRAALSGEVPRRLEIQMDSVIRPRDIQARIRAGETPEAVAQAAQTSVDKIMVYAGPVLDERQHVAERAQRASVRRRGGDTSQVRTLGEAVAAHLRSINVDPTTVVWDAWRREDGRWSLTAQFGGQLTGPREGTAQFTYDTPGNYALLDNDDARWLVGEVVASPEVQPDDLHERRRRLSAVPGDESTDPPDTSSEELPLGVDAIELVHTDVPLAAFLDDSLAADEPAPGEQPADASADEDDEQSASDADTTADENADDGAPSRRSVQKKRGRASVPSWDEIMFGGGDQ